MNGVYTFTPESLTPSLRFKVVTAGRTVKAQLSAENFDNVSVSLEPWENKTIGIGKIKVNDKDIPNKTPVTFTIYSTNPGKTPDPGNAIGTFTAYRGQSNQEKVELSLTKEQYDALLDKTVYVRFSVTNKTYYVDSSKTLRNLMDGTTLQSFIQQK